jgi:hypothetical protein
MTCNWTFIYKVSLNSVLILFFNASYIKILFHLKAHVQNLYMCASACIAGDME